MTWTDKIKRFFVENITRRFRNRDEDEAAKAKAKVVKTLKENPITAMIETYTKAEKKWLTSSLSNGQEKEYRLNFLRTYKNELEKLNTALGNVAPNNRPEVLEKLEEAGISELLKDYNAVFNRGENGLIPYNTQYLMQDQNNLAKLFRDDMAEKADKEHYITEPLDEGIAKFQKFLYSKIDYKSDGSSRLFTESFMTMPPKQKLKVLYSIENNLLDSPVTDEMLQDYHPDGSKLIFEATASRFKFRKKRGSADPDYEKIKRCIDKESLAAENAEIMAENAEPQAEENAPGKTQPELKRTKRHINNIVVNTLSAGATIGSIGVSVPLLLKPTVALKNASDGLGVVMSAIDVGKSLTELVIAGKNRTAMTNAMERIKELKKTAFIKDSQKKALEKLESNAKTVHTLNKGKTKTQVVNTISSGVNLTAAVVNPKTSLVVLGVTALISAPIKSKIKSYTLTNVVDEHLFKTKEEFDVKKTATISQTNSRLLRLPRKQQEKYQDTVKKFMNDDKAIRASLRDEGVRQAGEVDLEGFTNKIIYDVSDSTYLLLREQAHKKNMQTQDQMDMAIEEIAKSVVKAAGGKEIDFSGMTNLGEKAKPAEREYVAKDLSKRAMDMSRS